MLPFIKFCFGANVRKSLEYNIILFVFIILFLTTVANTGMDVAVYRRDYIAALSLRTISIAQAMKYSVEKVLVLGIELKEIPGMDEKCREMVASNPEISYTVITSTNGSVIHANDAEFSKLQFPVSDTISNSPSILKTKNSSIAYFNTSTAVQTYDGKIAGYIHVGFPQKNINSKVFKMALRSGGIFLFFFFLSFALLIIFIKKNIVKPIDVLLKSVTKISEGDFNISIPRLPANELAELADKIAKMANILSNRDNELRNNFIELATTHGRLAESFQQLETLSQQLEKSEKLYKSLLEDSSEAIIVLDENENISIVNKKATDLLGYEPDELLNKHLLALLILINAENIPDLLQISKNTSSGEQLTGEFSVKTKAGEPVIVKVQNSHIRAGGQSLLQMIIHDVTSERLLLNNLEKSAKELEKLNKMKDSFIGVASHEIKTPLTIIMGYTELLLQEPSLNLQQDSIEMLENISNASNRLNNIVKDMIDVSMLDRKNVELRPEPLNINSVVEQSARENRVFFSSRKQTLKLALNKEPLLIYADRERLMQLLSNIISNAIKFTPDGNQIEITTRVREILLSKNTNDTNTKALDSHLILPQRFVEIAVHDSGIGIDKEDQTRIFDKFYEAGNIEEHGTGKSAFQARGTGLGLAISKGIVEMHGGKIWVESGGFDPVNCNGSTFFILLPLDQMHCDDTIYSLATVGP